MSGSASSPDPRAGRIIIAISEEQAEPGLGPGWTGQPAGIRIEPETLARRREVVLYAAEAAGLLSRLFATRLQRPGLIRRMTVTLDVER